MILLTVISALLYSSLVEYCLHRFVQHRSYKEDHIKNHHRIFHGLKSYEFKKVNASEIFSSGTEMLRNAALYLPPAILIFIQAKAFGVLFFAVCFIYSFWSEFLHLNFHRSAEMFLTQHEFFKRLKEHHRVHHYIYNSNYGIGSSFWDTVFRTKKTADNHK